MGYRLPTFNLAVGAWRFGNDVQLNPPDVVTAGNLVGGHHGLVPPVIVALNTVANMKIEAKATIYFSTLLLPKGADVRPYMNGPAANWGDCVEVPAGSGRFYAVMHVDDIGRGFPNEHRFALVTPLYGYLTAAAVLSGWNAPAWPVPIP